MLKNQLLCCWAIGFLLAGEVIVNITPGSGGKWLNINREALARSSGESEGESSGGRPRFSCFIYRRSSNTSPSSSNSSSSSSSSNSSNSSSPSNSPSDSSSSSRPTRPSNNGNTGGRVRSGSFEKPASPAPVVAPKTRIPRYEGKNKTVIIPRRTDKTDKLVPRSSLPSNPGNSQPKTRYNPQPARILPRVTPKNNWPPPRNWPSLDTPGKRQPNIRYEQKPAVNPAPITTKKNSGKDRSSPSSENPDNTEQNIRDEQQPTVNPVPVTTKKNSGKDRSSPSLDNPGKRQPNIRYEQQPAINLAPITPKNNYGNDTISPSLSQDGGWFWLWLFVSGAGVALIAYCIYYYRQKSGDKLKVGLFAVSKLQVAMLVEARGVQSQLTELALKFDAESATARAEFLQEAVLIVLRLPESWTHFSADSQTVASREEAAQIFNQISIQERSKLSVETLSIVNGDICGQESVSDGNRDPGEYIVVTFLIGTDDTKSLFGDIRDIGELKAALERAAATPAESLLVFELIWSPQQETDSLTGDELLSSYADLIPVG
ncbi:hypothetical protein C7B67_26545 [filamentous cyanobacterium Phorm 6]|nr:hypothetical protein C7B67_26545 [filamentous cyanobacterium Phorm 6]